MREIEITIEGCTNTRWRAEQKRQMETSKEKCDKERKEVGQKPRQHPHASQETKEQKPRESLGSGGSEPTLKNQGRPRGYSSGLYRFWLRILVIVNMWTRSCLNTARMASSHRICRRSLGSCKLFSRIYCHTFLTVCGRDSY